MQSNIIIASIIFWLPVGAMDAQVVNTIASKQSAFGARKLTIGKCTFMLPAVVACQRHSTHCQEKEITQRCEKLNREIAAQLVYFQSSTLSEQQHMLHVAQQLVAIRRKVQALRREP